MYVAHERRAYILRLLEQQGHLRSAELARDLGVTDETIRTDLVHLQKQGLLQRIHGGARYILPAGKEGATTRGAESAMADRLAERIQPGMCLYMDAAPFSLLLAWKLRGTPCRLITASARLLHQLSAKALGHRLFCPGGELGKESGLFPTEHAQDYLQAMAPDAAILRPDALTPYELGYNNPVRAAWAEAAIRSARQLYVAAPVSHFSAHASHTIPSRPDLLLTEDALPEEWNALPYVETVPYISRESLLPPDGFDY